MRTIVLSKYIITLLIVLSLTTCDLFILEPRKNEMDPDSSEYLEVNGIPRAGLIVEYLFDDSAEDTSGNNNNCSIYGATLTTDRFGKENSAYSFDGSNDYLESNNTVSIDTSAPLSICAWIYLYSTDVTSGIVTVNTNSDGGPVLNNNSSNLTSEGVINFYNGDTTADCASTKASILNINTWYFLVGVVENNTVKLYINGSLENTITYDTDDNNSTIVNDPIRIGIDHLDRGYFNGKIDDIRIYKKVLSISEINSIFQEKGLVLIYEDFFNSDNGWDKNLMTITEGYLISTGSSTNCYAEYTLNYDSIKNYDSIIITYVGKFKSGNYALRATSYYGDGYFFTGDGDSSTSNQHFRLGDSSGILIDDSGSFAAGAATVLHSYQQKFSASIQKWTFIRDGVILNDHSYLNSNFDMSTITKIRLSSWSEDSEFDYIKIEIVKSE